MHRRDRKFRLHHVRPQVRLAGRGDLGQDVPGCPAPAVPGPRPQAEAGGGQPELWQLFQAAG